MGHSCNEGHAPISSLEARKTHANPWFVSHNYILGLYACYFAPNAIRS
jgi:hypothetical protein